MDKNLPGPRHRGLTLIELIITLALLAITVTLGAPSLQGLLYSNQLRSEAGRLVGALNLARSEAIIRNTAVSLCPATGESICSGGYAGGWVVFSNTDRNLDFDEQADEIIRTFAGVPPGYTLTDRSGSRPASGVITYFPDGSSRRNLTLLVCAPGTRELAPWSVVLNRVGRARVSQGEGTCPAPGA